MAIQQLRHILPDTAATGGGGELVIGGCGATELAAVYGTPLFVFCEQTFVNRARAFRQAFPGATVYYAAKAFLSRAICRLAEREGLSIDVASGGELYTALAAGFPAERIILHGNNKQDPEIQAAVQAGAGRIAVDNLEDVDRIAAAAREFGRRQAVVIRLTPGVRADTHRHIQTGHHDSKFGLSIAGGAARRAICLAAHNPDLKLMGVHAHIGSNIFSPDPFQEMVEVLFGFLAELRREEGLELQELNLGGGFGVPCVAGDQPVDIHTLGKLVLGTAAAQAERYRLQLPRLCFEPGRWMIGNAMVTIYSVGSVKQASQDLTFVSVDGGMSDNIRPALYQAPYTAILANRRTGGGDMRAVTLAGVHCESGDVLAEGVELPATVRRGDLVAIPATGAYGYSMASNYNKKPRPAVVTAKDGRAELMIRRETFEDLLRLEVTE